MLFLFKYIYIFLFFHPFSWVWVLMLLPGPQRPKCTRPGGSRWAPYSWLCCGFDIAYAFQYSTEATKQPLKNTCSKYMILHSPALFTPLPLHHVHSSPFTCLYFFPFLNSWVVSTPDTDPAILQRQCVVAKYRCTNLTGMVFQGWADKYLSFFERGYTLSLTNLDMASYKDLVAMLIRGPQTSSSNTLRRKNKGKKWQVTNDMLHVTHDM